MTKLGTLKRYSEDLWLKLENLVEFGAIKSEKAKSEIFRSGIYLTILG